MADGSAVSLANTLYWYISKHTISTNVPRARTTYYVLRTTYYVLRTTYYVLRATCYVLRATCYVLRVTCYVLRATCYVLRATYYVLRTTYYVPYTKYILHSTYLIFPRYTKLVYGFQCMNVLRQALQILILVLMLTKGIKKKLYCTIIVPCNGLCSH